MGRVAVELFDDLDALARDADGGLDRAAMPDPYARLSWLRLVAAHAPPPGRPLFLRGEAGGRRGWLALARRGRRAEAFANWYTLAVPLPPDHDVMAAIAGRLRAEGLATLSLAPLAEPDAAARAFRAAGWTVRTTPATANWRLALNGRDFDAYWRGRPGRLRALVARKAGIDARIYDRFDADAWDAYEAVYAASWKPKEGAPAMLHALAEQEGAAGTLRLGIARREGRAVAAQLWLVEDGIATIHKLAYRADARALSPGTLLSAAMFRHAIDADGVALIDYGTGDEAYKADWMEERRTLWRLDAFDLRRPAGLAAAARAAVSALAGRVRSR